MPPPETTTERAVMIFYVDQMLDEKATLYRTGKANLQMDYDSAEVLFPKQYLQDGGSSLNLINGTEHLSEILSSSDDVTAVFVTGLVFAYVICLSLPVIFVTACSLYIKRMQNADKNNAQGRKRRKGRYRQKATTRLPESQGSPLVLSAGPAASSNPSSSDATSPDRKEKKVSIDEAVVTEPPPSNADKVKPGSPGTTRRAALVRVAGPTRTLIPLQPLFMDWDEVDGTVRGHQNPIAREFPNLYDTPPPPEKFADKPNEPSLGHSPTSPLSTESSFQSSSSGEPRCKKPKACPSDAYFTAV